MKNRILICLLLFTHIQVSVKAQYLLTGQVRDQQNNLLSGVSVALENSQWQSFSDQKGSFKISGLKSGDYKLLLRTIGFENKTFTIHIFQDTNVVIHLDQKVYLTDEILISASRTGQNAGMAVNLLSKEEIEKLNTGQDLPYLLQLLPSTVITSDAGNGIGYTGLRIRGSDPTRINVTINGIPVNDAESQLVYWVNMPDFASSAENIEITRGAGSSTNGAGAFGGSINIRTQQLNDSSFAQSSHAAGSFKTFKHNISFGTGLLKNQFILEGRASSISSDGYVDRGSSVLQSIYMSAAWKNKKNILRLNVFTGKEITYQSWYGVPESRITGDRQGMLDYGIRNGLSEEELLNLLNSGRNYNYYTYDDQTDNYSQDHYQLLFSHALNNKWVLNFALHATNGRGYYEEYKNNADLSDYGIAPVAIGDTLIEQSDLIRRRWLENKFYGSTWTLTGNVNNKLELTFGGAVNRYKGAHFGEVIWARFSGNSGIRHRYYDNDAVKDDFNSFLKTDWSLSDKINLYIDLQYRFVHYTYEIPGQNVIQSSRNSKLNFFNPKIGFTIRPDPHFTIYGSASVANKEPNREDFTESSPLSIPVAEKLIDYEAGISWNERRIRAGVNFYYMDYFDQLVLTGKVNDVGNYTRTNIDRSYRTGVETEVVLQLLKNLSLQGNFTLSDNRIRRFVSYTDQYDVDYNYTGQKKEVLTNSVIAFSPALTASGQLTYQLFKNTEACFIIRYVSQQYLDNTQQETSIIPAYTVADLRMSYIPAWKFCRKFRFDLLLNNVFNQAYVSNGYTFGYYYDTSRIRENFYYPQAGFNLMGQLTFRF